jgi:hypothetical protein
VTGVLIVADVVDIVYLHIHAGCEVHSTFYPFGCGVISLKALSNAMVKNIPSFHGMVFRQRQNITLINNFRFWRQLFPERHPEFGVHL